MSDKQLQLIDQAEQVLGYRFNDGDLLRTSLKHASGAGHYLDSNERLEFLGDAILGYVICQQLFMMYPDEREGELTKIKSVVVSRHTCAKVSNDLGLTDMLILGKGMDGQGDLPSSLAAGVYESIIAAIYIDGGLEKARDFILKSMNSFIEEAAASAHQQNFKSLLQQYAQRHLADMPNYVLLDEKGPDHSKCFEICVEIAGRHFQSAWGQSKKQSEQRAALNALEVLGVVQVDEDKQVTVIDSE